jgi:serine/threonine protein phosphatase PrpC
MLSIWAPDVQNILNANGEVRPVSFTFEVIGKTDVGCVRVTNEDNFGYDSERGIFVVCDGMGGHAAGEVASRIAVDSLLKYFHQCPALQEQDAHVLAGTISKRALALGDAIQLANIAIHEASCRDEAYAGMGSTIACVLAKENLFSVGHVGDSRVYLIREGAIERLTQDHSLVVQQMRMGLMSPDEAERSKLQNVITKALGAEPDVEPDFDERVALPDDVLVLASDGLTRSLSEQQILAVISATANLRHACDKLIQMAKDAGGEDNITCLLIRFVELRWYQSLLSNLGLAGAGSGKVIS